MSSDQIMLGVIPARRTTGPSEAGKWASWIWDRRGQLSSGEGARLPYPYSSKGNAASRANSIKAGKVKAWREAGEWDAVVRSDADGIYWVWVSPRNSNMTGAS